MNSVKASDFSGVGIFGGTFDPVHFGHLRAALEVSEQLEIQDFRLIPAGSPPHREPPEASAGHRLAMLRRAVAKHDRFRVDDREVRRSGRSYMVDTLRSIRREENTEALMLIVGQDAANELDGWHRWRELFELAHLIVMHRPDAAQRYSDALAGEIRTRLADGPAALSEERCGRVLRIEVTQLDISSTDIRARLRAGRSASFLTPQSVVDYIHEAGLYRAR